MSATIKKSAPSIEQLQAARDLASAKHDAARAALDSALITMGSLQNDRDQLEGMLNDAGIDLQSARDSDARSHSAKSHAKLSASQRRFNEAHATLSAFDSTGELADIERQVSLLQVSFEQAQSTHRGAAIQHQDTKTSLAVRSVLTSFDALLSEVERLGPDILQLDGPLWWQFEAVTHLDGAAWAELGQASGVRARRTMLNDLLRKLS